MAAAFPDLVCERRLPEANSTASDRPSQYAAPGRQVHPANARSARPLAPLPRHSRSGAPAKATQPSRFFRASAAPNDSLNSLATAAVIELLPMGRLREKIRPASIKRTLVVRAPISSSSEQPFRSV